MFDFVPQSGLEVRKRNLEFNMTDSDAKSKKVWKWCWAGQKGRPSRARGQRDTVVNPFRQNQSKVVGWREKDKGNKS